MPINLTTVRAYDVAGIRRRVVGVITGPAVYIPGGETITAAQLKLGEIEAFFATSVPNAALAVGYHIMFVVNAVGSQGQLIWWNCTTGAEVAGGTNLSAVTTRFEALGK